VFFRIVTPCGGDLSDVEVTLTSVERVLELLPTIDICVYRVFNNGMLAPTSQIRDWSFSLVDIDINPAASPALARNAALDYISHERIECLSDDDYLVFLDAGDILLPNLLSEVSERRASGDIIVGASLIRSQRRDFPSLRLPLYFKYVVNPIYLGSAISRTHLVLMERFIEGRKEDWKFWLALLKKEPRVTKHKALNYVYTIVGRGNHARRKSKLVDKQYAFYREHLRLSIVASLILLFCHYLTHALLWWVLQPATQVCRDICQKLRSLNK
jgi:glycosyltransferase involved in cell wall biosynthesis